LGWGAYEVKVIAESVLSTIS
jgi:hypothetical protein